MALRLAWSTCRSVRFRRDGSWERQAAAVAGRRSARWRSRRRLRRRGARQRPAPAAAGPGQRRDHRRARSPCSRGRSPSAPNDPADPPEPEPRRSRRSAPTRRSNVVFVAANLTDVADPPGDPRARKDASSGPLFANSTGTLQIGLPTGVYMVAAADIPGAKPGQPRRRPLPRLVRRTTSCCPSRAWRIRPAWRLTRPSTIGAMTVVLAIAVVLLAAGLVYALVSAPREQPAARPRAGDPGGDLEQRSPTCSG